MHDPAETHEDRRTFLTEYQRGARAGILGAVLGIVLAMLGRRS
jgi:hypothetical protein